MVAVLYVALNNIMAASNRLLPALFFIDFCGIIASWFSLWNNLSLINFSIGKNLYLEI